MIAAFVRVPYYVGWNDIKIFFLPACRMAAGYRIGPKGEEATVFEYWDALARLAAMRPPRVRRPNVEKNFGIVKCEPEAFDAVSRTFLEDEVGKHRG